MKNKKPKELKYTGYNCALIIIGLSSFVATGFYIFAYVNNCNCKNWLSLLVGILWGLNFSILTAFLIKQSDDKRYDKSQKGFVKNLHDCYLEDFREALKNYTMYYVNAFKPTNEYSLFKDIQNDNQINIDALIYNFGALQNIKDNVEEAEGWPSNKSKWIINNLKNLCITHPNSCYCSYFYKLTKEANKIIKIANIENKKYKYSIFSEDELMYLERYEDANYYYNMSNNLQLKNIPSFSNSNIQLVYQHFIDINNQLKLFSIDLVPVKFIYPTGEEIEILEEDIKHFTAVAKSGKDDAKSIIDENKTHV